MSKRLRIAGTLLLLSFVLLVALWQVSRSRTFQLCGEIVPRVETARKVVALTFDDGPTPGATDSILVILERGKVPATFFVTGRELQEYMDEGRRIVAAGHELGNNTYLHKRMILMHVMYPSRIESMKAIPAMIERLTQQGYTFVTVSELLALGGHGR